MNKISSCLLVLLLAFGSLPANAVEYGQTISLSYGWNAVWLEVEPRDTNGLMVTAADVFTSDDFIIDMVAVLINPEGTAEFSTDPGQLFNQPDWKVWSRSPSSTETDAIVVRGNQAYLLHVIPTTGALTNGVPAGDLVLTGEVSFYRPAFARGSYNLTGFSVEGSPTFEALLRSAEYSFSATPAGSPVQRLNPATGLWEGAGGHDVVESGRAYWISVPFDLVSSKYAGPVAVDFMTAPLGSLQFGYSPASTPVQEFGNPSNTFLVVPGEMTFSSFETEGAANHTVTLTKLTDPGDTDIELYRLERVPDQLNWRNDSNGILSELAIGTLAPGDSQTITLGLRRNWSSEGDFREHLYRISVALAGGSVYYYLPVSAGNADITPEDQPVDNAADFAGLWLGDVIIDAASSITEAARPVRATSSRVPLRMMIHVDTNGAPVMLAHVMQMQTKTADPSVAPREVLILDESQIPFYEGIVERGGKKVGVRYETVTYDLPRDNRVSSQSTNFLNLVLASSTNGYTNLAQITDADVSAYLASRDSRPPSLEEVYYKEWPLAGVFGPGNHVGTATDAPLRLDAFHRTNPYRHAYHPQHGAGYDIVRAFTIRFDADYETGSGLLTGTYEETTSGIATVDLISRGRIQLQRVSFVGEME